MKYTIEDLQLLEQQEKQAIVDEWNDDIVLKIGIIISQQAKKYDRGIIIRIVRENDGMICYQYTMDDKTSRNIQYLDGKHKAIQYFGHSSAWLYVKKILHPDFDTKDAMYSGGAFPIYDKNDKLAGSILVSGLHDGEDHALIIDAMNEAIHADILPFRKELK